MNKKVKRIELSDELHARCQRHRLETCKDVLLKSEYDLVRLLDVSLSTASDLMLKASQYCCPALVTAADLLQLNKNTRPIRTTLDDLDAVLHGGIPVGSITEVVGPPGVGKTQFCHAAAVMTIVEGAGVLYFDTENSFSATRLVEIARAKFPRLVETEAQLEQLAQAVKVFTINNTVDLIARLEAVEDIIVESHVRLIILDSIASIVRTEFDHSTILQRQNLLVKEASILKYLGETFRLPVVVVNQITTVPDTAKPSALPTSINNGDLAGQLGDDANPLSGEKRGGQTTAALGVIWSHCVNTRLVLEFSNDKTQAVRLLTVAKSPVAPVITFPYVITSAGMELHQPDRGARYYLSDENYPRESIRSAQHHL